MEETLRVSREQLTKLEKNIEAAGLWTIFPQFFVEEPGRDDICIDGMTVILERVDTRGYRYAEGNAQCTLGALQTAVAETLVRMAKQPDLMTLLH